MILFLLRRLFALIKWCFIAVIVTSVLGVFFYKYMPVYYTPLMFIRVGEQVSEGRKPILKHTWVDREKITPYLAQAVMTSEDQRFLKHNGFDMVEISNALSEHYVEGKRMRGGSTISQQTAKNVFLWPTSSWLRKGFEVYFTLLIELFWSKERIMEVYLNSIEMGDGIYGVSAVAEAHFDTDSSGLTKKECALIAATLPNPLKYDSANPSAYVQKRQKAIYAGMKRIPLLWESSPNNE